MRDNRTKRQRAKAALRIGQDRPNRLEDVAALVGVSLMALIRWVCLGKRGVFLDAVRDGECWFSSVAAVERFRDAVSQKTVSSATGPQPQAASAAHR
jgi:hypothetical protein